MHIVCGRHALLEVMTSSHEEYDRSRRNEYILPFARQWKFPRNLVVWVAVGVGGELDQHSAVRGWFTCNGRTTVKWTKARHEQKYISTRTSSGLAAETCTIRQRRTFEPHPSYGALLSAPPSPETLEE